MQDCNAGDTKTHLIIVADQHEPSGTNALLKQSEQISIVTASKTNSLPEID
jgi:hypothetical protein